MQMTRHPFRRLLIGVTVLAALLGGIISLAPAGLYALGSSDLNSNELNAR